MMPRAPRGRRAASDLRPRPRQTSARRRLPGELGTTEFLRGLLEATQARLPTELQALQAQQEGSLVKLFADDPRIHFELWLHRGRERAELGLHFETRDPPRNQRLLDYVAEDLPFLKTVLGTGLEAEPWDKGWTRVYLTLPVTRLDAGAQAELAMAFGELIETLEPFRREAVDATVDPDP
jgi:hypothetical protein